MTTLSNINALQTAIIVAVTGEHAYPATGAPPELAAILACTAPLPEVAYVLLDSGNPDWPTPGAEQVTQAVLTHNAHTVAQWSGDLPGSMGYGEVEYVATSHGPALVISLGGSAHASATSLWVAPLTLASANGYVE